MALKRTKVLGWTKNMGNVQRLVSNLARAGKMDEANKLNEANRKNHQQRAANILRNARH